MNEGLLSKYPGLDNVASFLGETAKTSYRMSSKYELFDNLGIASEEEFVNLVDWGNEEAVRVYERTKEILGF